MNIFPSEIGEIVEDHLVIGEEYQMVAYTKDGMVEFKVMVELTVGRNGPEVTKALKEAIRRRFEMRIEVAAVLPGTLPRSDYKSKRFLDETR